VKKFAFAGEERAILGDPGAASWGNGIFTGESLQQERESPWAFTLTERVPEALEIPLADWPEKFFWPIGRRDFKLFWNPSGESKCPGALPFLL